MHASNNNRNNYERTHIRSNLFLLRLKMCAFLLICVTVILPGTGEHGFGQRKVTIAKPLARNGVASIIVEGAYYGKRKPPNQFGSKLRRVSDLPILGKATIEETRAILHWLKEDLQYEYLAVAGRSMGGLHAAMTGSLTDFPVGVVSWVAPPSAIPAFTKGLLSSSCSWDSLVKDGEKNSHHLKDLCNFVEKYYPDVYSSADCKEEILETSLEKVKVQLEAFLTITNIHNFPSPVRADAAIFAVATEDQYIGLVDSQWKRLSKYWKGSTVKYVQAGHVSGILFERNSFLESIESVLTRLKYSGE